MKSLQKDLQAFARELKALTQTTEKLTQKMAAMERADTPKAKKERRRGTTKSAKESGETVHKKITGIETVFTAIRKSRKGANMDRIKTKTGFNDRKIWNAIYRLKNEGKIKNIGRGVYGSI